MSNTVMESPATAMILPHHLAELRRSGLSDATIAAAGIYSETNYIQLATILGWRKYPKRMGAAMVFPFRGPDGASGYARLKPDNPRYVSGKPVKYESPKGRSNEVYFPPGMGAIIDNPPAEVLLTEGEKKACKATQEGFPTIGLVGVYGWKDGKSTQMLPVLERIKWSGVKAVIAFDSDIADKPEVQDAESRLADQLTKRGAVVRVLRMPPGTPGADGKPTKMGLDDFLVANPPGELKKLIDGADEPAAVDPVCMKADAKDADAAVAAARFLDLSMVDGLPRLRFWRGAFHLWTAGAYRELQTAEVQARLVRGVNEDYRRVTTRMVGDVMMQMKAQSLLSGSNEPPAWLDEPPVFADDKQYWPATGVLVTKNQMVCLPRLVEGRQCTTSPTPRYFSTSALDYDFAVDAPEPTAWLAFLRQLWDDDQGSIDVLQEWFGYSLTPDTRLQKILLLVGPKRAGKGVIARVQRALVGNENVAGPTLSSLASHFGLWPLLGKSLAIISDARLSGRVDQSIVVERLLSVSGEDALTIDRKNLEPVTGKLSTRLMILSNELPRLGDSSGAMVGRMIVLRLTNSFYGKEDPGLTDKLLAELPGILLWAIEGWRRLHVRGYFRQPDSALELLGEMTDLCSPVGAFVRERCAVGPGYRAAVDDLFAEWRGWCEVNGRREPGTVATFGRDLIAAVPELRRVQPREGDKRYRAYEGIGLVSGV